MVISFLYTHTQNNVRFLQTPQLTTDGPWWFDGIKPNLQGSEWYTGDLPVSHPPGDPQNLQGGPAQYEAGGHHAMADLFTYTLILNNNNTGQGIAINRK